MSPPKDIFSSLPALMAKLSENEDYIIRSRNRGSKVTVVSPHGGYIEPGTSAIAEAVAGRTFNFFDFQGFQVERPWELHVTSTRFRHPALEQLLSQSSHAVSIHGMGEVDRWNIWIGGLNVSMKERMATSLQKAGFSVITDTPKYRGEDPRNIVNLVSKMGVQLELPSDLIDAMFVKGVTFPGLGVKPKTTRLFTRFVKAVRSAVLTEIRTR
ncbi:MAG: poly-gamma-glutamate hydrolase family protein [Candidatus Melainabacteria bacterium]|nr:poly-gamma-glutamate hydrolase family protein [Candidatus Melainabacteria bacterium]